jgi:hypothetical protein
MTVTRRLEQLVAAAGFLAATAALATAVPPATGAPATSYYVDSILGDDAAAGTTPRTAWRTLARAARAPLAAGDRLLLRRGGRWAGPLAIAAAGTAEAPIVVGTYGAGPRPVVDGGDHCVALSGPYVVVDGLRVENCWAGVELEGGFETVRNVVAAHNVAGVRVAPAATDARVVENVLVDNNRMSVLTRTPTDDDSGAFGILLQGDRTVVARNRISGSDAFSYDFGRDGSAIEVYGGRDNLILDNLAVDDQAFTELGNARSADNTYAYNVVFSSLATSTFAVTRGAGSRFGPVRHTRLLNNTVVLVGNHSQGFVCDAGCGPDILTLRNNIVQAVWKTGYADARLDEDYDLFYGGRAQFALGPHSLVAPPQFVNEAARNFHLRASSPAVDRGIADGFKRDFDGRRVPVDGNGDGRAVPDLGAFEYRPPHRYCSTRGQTSTAPIASSPCATQTPTRPRVRATHEPKKRPVAAANATYGHDSEPA